MAARQPPPPRASSIYGSSTSAASSSRKIKSINEEIEGSKKGPSGSNGSQVGATRQQSEEGSDCDELGDSESDRGQADQTVKKESTSTTTTSGTKGKTGRSRGRPSAASTTAKATASSATGSRRASSIDSKQTATTSGGTIIPSKRSPPLATDRGSASEAKPRTTAEYSREASRSTARSSSSAPYYYHSFRDETPLTTIVSHKSDAAIASNAEDLTMHEVDKFLDLIEKHNLHTSNEDDMARSVTELYQEWLEWCAKRSVQSTKSKQALVAEFVRIHQGQYGRLRQERAMEIVKGRAGGMQDGDQNPLTTDLIGQPISYLPSSKSAPSLAAVPRYKEEERDGHLSKSVSASTGSKRNAPSGQSSNYIHVPSPSVAPRALTPGPTSSSLQDSHAQSDLMYRRIRDNIWKEASIMIERIVHEQMAVMMEKNSALRGRVEQLEVHSDNLAQWIQHLNRVQDDLTQSIQSAPPPHPPPQESMVVEEQHQPVPSMYSRHPVEHRSYAPAYTATQSSPKRSYAIRRSPSPPIITHHPSATVAHRNIGDRDQQPRDTREYYHGHPSRVAMSDPYDRPYYTYPSDDRDQHQQQQTPLTLPSHSPQHQAKRARNGY